MQSSTSKNDNIRIRTITTVAEGRYVLQKYTFDYLRRDGKWQQLSREVYKRRDSAVILLYCRSQGTIVLTRQFRLPVFVNDVAAGMLVEAPAGLLGCDPPATAIRREAEEETGIRVDKVEEVFEAYMSPGLLAECTHFFIGEYGPYNWKSPGGGLASEGEDIESFEISFGAALSMLERREIVDAKTILLLLYAKTRGLFDIDPFSSNTETGLDRTREDSL